MEVAIADMLRGLRVLPLGEWSFFPERQGAIAHQHGRSFSSFPFDWRGWRRVENGSA